MNNFIVTSQGFFKQAVRDITNEIPTERGKFIIQYTDKLREAHRFKTKKTAYQLMEKIGIEGFVYNPWSEEPIRNMYEVKQAIPSWMDETGRKSYYVFRNGCFFFI